MELLRDILAWFTGGSAHPYMTLYHCMSHDQVWIGITVALDLAVAAGYLLIARHWYANQQILPDSPAKTALAQMKNIFLFCGMCGYLFIPIKMFWPAWRLYDLFMVALVYFTWRYALNASNLRVVYNELGRSTRLAEDLEKSREEARRKAVLFNAISHDLRTPLNCLNMHAQLAELSAVQQNPRMLQESLSEIRNSTRAAAELLDSLLEFARSEYETGATVSTFDLNELIARVLGSTGVAAKAKNIHLRAPVDGALMVRSDHARLQRILLNLLDNAVKYTSPGGSVELRVDRASDSLEVHIIDTGRGIPPEDQERVFHEFCQLHNPERDRSKGFGLGLSVCRRLARQLGGDVVVHSAPGQGSRFTVLLPGVLADGPDTAPPGDGNGQAGRATNPQPASV